MKPLLLLIVLVVAASPATPTPFRARLPPRPRLPPAPPIPPVAQSPPPPPPSGRSGVLGAGAPPADCMMPLSQMLSCVDFLTNSSNLAPTARCCDGFRSVVNSSAIICLCHVMDRDLSSFTQSPPINMFRAVLLPVECAVVLPIRAFTMCSFEYIPPMNAAPPPPALDAVSGGK